MYFGLVLKNLIQGKFNFYSCVIVTKSRDSRVIGTIDAFLLLVIFIVKIRDATQVRKTTSSFVTIESDASFKSSDCFLF